MTSIQLKSSLHGFIENINDKALLEKVYSLLKNNDKLKDDDYWDTISKEEQAAIEEGIAQADKGEVVPLLKMVAEGRAIYKK